MGRDQQHRGSVSPNHAGAGQPEPLLGLLGLLGSGLRQPEWTADAGREGHGGSSAWPSMMACQPNQEGSSATINDMALLSLWNRSFIVVVCCYSTLFC